MDSMAIHFTGRGPLTSQPWNPKKKKTDKSITGEWVRAFHGPRAHLAFLLVILRAVHLAGQSEISHLDDVVVREEDVARREVSVQHLEASRTRND